MEKLMLKLFFDKDNKIHKFSNLKIKEKLIISY